MHHCWRVTLIAIHIPTISQISLHLWSWHLVQNIRLITHYPNALHAPASCQQLLFHHPQPLCFNNARHPILAAQARTLSPLFSQPLHCAVFLISVEFEDFIGHPAERKLTDTKYSHNHMLQNMTMHHPNTWLRNPQSPRPPPLHLDCEGRQDCVIFCCMTRNTASGMNVESCSRVLAAEVFNKHDKENSKAEKEEMKCILSIILNE